MLAAPSSSRRPLQGTFTLHLGKCFNKTIINYIIPSKSMCLYEEKQYW